MTERPALSSIAMAALWNVQPATARLLERHPALLSRFDSQLLAIATEAARLERIAADATDLAAIADKQRAELLARIRAIATGSTATEAAILADISF